MPPEPASRSKHNCQAITPTVFIETLAIQPMPLTERRMGRRRRYMTLESIAPVSDNLTVKLPAVAA